MWIEQSQISSAARMSACSVCGSNLPEVPALSTGVDVLYEGIIEICKRCIVEAAAIYGLISADLLTEQAAQIEELRDWSEAAYAELAAKQSTIETIAAALATVVAERDALRAEVPA